VSRSSDGSAGEEGDTHCEKRKQDGGAASTKKDWLAVKERECPESEVGGWVRGYDGVD